MIQKNTISCVAILMATRNGERFIGEQLDSIVKQTHSNWKVFISDDNSIDNTESVIKRYQRQYPNQIYYTKARFNSFSKNFLSLCNDSSIKADFYAFCDQDDVWHPDKLELGIRKLEAFKGQTALFCSRTHLVDAGLNSIGYSPLMKKTPSFKNALIQNIAGGNTMIFSQKVKSIFEKLKIKDCVSHDWLTYLLTTGSEGVVIYSAKPCIDYRQHNQNLIGSNQSLKAKLFRLIAVFNNRLRIWNLMNIQALYEAQQFLTDKSKVTLRLFEQLHHSRNLNERIRIKKKSGIYRQSIMQQISFWTAVIFRKV